MTMLQLFCVFLLSQCVVGEYTISCPKAFRIGASQKVVLNLHNYRSARVITTLRTQDMEDIIDRTVIDVNRADINDPIELDVMIQQDDTRQTIVNIPENRPLTVNLEIRVVASVMTNGSNGDFEERITVFVSKDSGYLFAVTDLPVYKPDDRVSITVFTLDQEMRETNIPVRVVIRTPPDGIGILPKIVQMLPGVYFAEHRFNLGPNPVFGIWKVEATYALAGYETTTETEFKVEKLVLPTFEMNIELEQNYILLNQPNIQGTIVSRYSYGEPVYGNYYLSAQLKKTPSSYPQEFFRLPPSGSTVYLNRDGTVRFYISIALLNNVLESGETIESLFESKATVFLQATVREQSIGTFESCITPDIPMITSPYEINKDRTSIFYNQGFVFPLKADVVFSIGKKPASGIAYQIYVNGQRVVPEPGSDDPQTNDLGQINSNILVPGAGDLEVAILLPLFQIRDNFTIYPYRSLSGNQLQIDLQQNAPFTVGSQLQIRFGFLNAQPTEIRYMILARGAIVYSGKSEPTENSVQSTAIVIVSQSMVPSGRIVAYYFTPAQNEVGSEIITNSLWFDVVDQCKSPGLVLETHEEVEPAARGVVRVGIRGQPRSLVHVKAVDKAAYFLFNNSRLTRDKIFKAMEDYDQGCIRNGGQNTESVFLESGLNLYSALHDPRPIESLNCRFRRLRKKRQADAEILYSIAPLKRSAENLLKKCAIDGASEPAVPGRTCDDMAKLVRKNVEADALPKNCSRVFLENCRNASRERLLKRLLTGIGMSAADDAADLERSLNNARTNFDPSMIHRTVRLDDQGRSIIFAPVSHSITTFEVDGVSVGSTEDSLCVSKTKEIRVFKDIFIQIFTPYSLKVREQANLRVAIFNYGRSSRTIKLDVMPAEDEILCTHFAPGRWNFAIQFTIGPRRSASTVVTVLPTNLPEGGTTEISFQARDSSEKFIYDQITKEVLIEQSGSLEDIQAISVPVDLNNVTNEQNFQLVFDFPVERVPGSRQCSIYAYSDFMGPIIEINEITQEPNNAESIIRMPYGCGEQNMLFSGINVYALMYLQSTGSLDEAAYNAVVQKIEDGYQRQLNYRTISVNPRVFAVFPAYRPSTWLNAFVVKVFTKAKEYDTDLDIRPICDALRWILTQQTAEGSFNQSRGLIHRTMKGAVGRNTTLTAYVVISLLETQSQCDPALNQQMNAAVDNAMVYLLANNDSLTFQKPFAIALLAYALALHQPLSPETTQIFNRLNNMKISTENSVHWEGTDASELRGTDIQAYWNGPAPLAVHIEATAYALLALITRERTHNNPRHSIIDETRKIALWLIAQRNSNGSFRSTQDTVIGLQALATYQTWVNSINNVRVPTNFTISLSAPDSEWNHEFQLTDADFRLRKEVSVPVDVIDGRFVYGVATGTGQGLVTYRCTYRTLAAEEPCDLNIPEPVLTVTNGHRQREIEAGIVKRDIRITFSVSKPGEPTGMSIIEVGLMSGFVAVEQSVVRLSLSDRVDGIIDRYEITSVSVVLYVRGITNDPLEISFLMRQEVLVIRPEPAKIKVYDYYEPVIYCGLYYSLNETQRLWTTNCGGENQEGICSCADGGCLTCRTREDQLTKTVCYSLEEGESCPVCAGVGCVDLIVETLKRNYVYEIVVTRVIPPAQGEIFFKFYANVERVLRAGTVRVNMGNELEFVVRQDCFRRCQDRELPLPYENTGIYSNIIIPNTRLLVMGSAPERTIMNNIERYRYQLDDALIEKVIPDRACNRYNPAKCRRPNANRERCERQRLLLENCREYAEFARRVQQGLCTYRK